MEGGDQRIRSGRERTVVITTKVGVSVSYNMLRGRWRQLVVTCLVFTNSVKLRGYLSAHTSSKDFELGPVLWCLKHFISWASAVWNLLEYVKGIYISIDFLYIIYFIFIWLNFDWRKRITFFEKISNWCFIARNNLYYKKDDHFRTSPLWCNYFEFPNMSNWRVIFSVFWWRTSTRAWAGFFSISTADSYISVT